MLLPVLIVVDRRLTDSVIYNPFSVLPQTFRCGRAGGEILIKEIAVNPVSRAQVEFKKKKKKKEDENYVYFSSEDGAEVGRDRRKALNENFCLLATTQHFLLIVKFQHSPNQPLHRTPRLVYLHVCVRTFVYASKAYKISTPSLPVGYQYSHLHVVNTIYCHG